MSNFQKSLKEKDDRLNNRFNETVEEFDPNGDQKKRIEFMIETILDLKNNKMKLVYDRDANQDVTRVKKTISNYLKEKGKLMDNHLTITWADLISEESKGIIFFSVFVNFFDINQRVESILDFVVLGKWWMVGSVWQSSRIDSKSSTETPSVNLSHFDIQVLLMNEITF
jgi:predicted HNH restriction endonuclease